VIVTLDHETHTYTTEPGVIVPGFSEICASVGVRKNGHWNSIGGGEFCANETAQDFGTALHAYAAFRLHEEECDYDPQIEPWVAGFEKYMFDNLDNSECCMGFEEVEISLCSKRYGYAGTPDFFRFVGSKELHVYDWKTATAMQLQKWRMQTAAYGELIQEHFHRVTKMVRHSVRIFEGGYQEDIRTGHPEDWYNWLAILNTFKIGRE